LLKDDLSTEHLNINGSDLALQLKPRRDREVSKRRRGLIDPEVQRPRDHWYEMKTPDFHLEARKNIEQLRMFCA
jgi:hypothetical protein